MSFDYEGKARLYLESMSTEPLPDEISSEFVGQLFTSSIEGITPENSSFLDIAFQALDLFLSLEWISGSLYFALLKQLGSKQLQIQRSNLD